MISIVTAYFNRKQLFYNTLCSIEKSTVKDIEVIVVDDCSSEEHRLEELQNQFNFLKIIRLEKINKWYINPCVPFNIGLKEAKGDIIVLQNPECFHAGDVLKHTLKNINNNNYISYSCYSLNQEKTELLTNHIHKTNKEINVALGDLPNVAVVQEGGLGWYNHPKFRPVGYHFLSAITKTNMEKLNGFDERYAHGISYDDDELLNRIKKIPLNVEILIQPLALHQWHYNTNNFVTQASKAKELVDKNRNLFYNTTTRENTYKAN